MKRTMALALGLGVAALAIWLTIRDTKPETSEVRTNGATKGGISFALHADRGRLHLQLTDVSSNEPMKGPKPRVWLDRGGEALDDAACRTRIKRLLDGRLAERADVDLNGWRILVRNGDNTLSVIDPDVGFRRTRLEALITLAGRSEDWALSPDNRALYVTVPEKNLLSFVDLGSFRLEGSVKVGHRPGTVSVAPDGKTVWVANEGEGTVSVVDVEERRVIDTLPSAAGRAHIAFREASGEVWVATALGETLRVYDVASRRLVDTVPIGAGAVGIDHNRTAAATYVGRSNGEVLEIEPASHRVSRRFQGRKGTSQLRSDPSGRWLMATNTGEGAVEVIDTSSGTIHSTLTGLDQPDAIDFSKNFTYLRTGGNGALALVETASLSATKPTLVEVSVGQRPVEASVRGGVLARTPIPGTFVVAHEADRALYVYGEGMMAPMATHLNHGREPKAVLVLDRSLQEKAPGTWTSGAEIREGSYRAVVLLDSPRVGVCFPVQIGEGEPPEVAPPGIVWHDPQEKPWVRGRRENVRLPVEGENGAKVDVLIFRLGGNLQWRLDGAIEEGAVVLPFEPPLPGRYRVLADVPSKDGRRQTRAFEWVAMDEEATR